MRSLRGGTDVRDIEQSHFGRDLTQNNEYPRGEFLRGKSQSIEERLTESR